MASSNSPSAAKTRHYKGTTSRGRERLKGLALLLGVPLLVLVAALARGAVREQHGTIPDWVPATAAAAVAH
jgi:hypothetical protein